MLKRPTIRLVSEYLADTKALRIAEEQLAVYQTNHARSLTVKKQTYLSLIDGQKQTISNLQLIVKRDEHRLSRIVQSEGEHYRVFFLHYVKKKSLKKTALMTSYTKDGVVSILRRIKQKCTQEKGR